MAEPEAPASKNRLPDVARIVGGLVVVAVVVGVGLWAERMTDDDLALPDKVAGLAMDDSPDGRDFAHFNSDYLSEAYDDADADTARYGIGTDTTLLVTAVRAKSGPPAPAAFSDHDEWVEDDDVTCLVTHFDERPDSILCQRDDGDLTVRVVALAGDLDVDDLVDTTNDVFEDVS
jgi:hypothetical protein